MSHKELAELVIAFVKERRGGVSFVEVERLLSKHIPTEGTKVAFSPDYPNVLWWIGMSDDFAAVMHEVGVSRKVEYRATSMLTYYIDGKVPNLPLVKGKSLKAIKAYKRPHWLPMTLYPAA